MYYVQYCDVISSTDSYIVHKDPMRHITRKHILFIIQVVRSLDATEEKWEIHRSEIKVGEKLDQGNYGAVFKGQLTVTAMSPAIYAHKKEMDFEGKSHLAVAVKMLRRSKCIHAIINGIYGTHTLFICRTGCAGTVV